MIKCLEKHKHLIFLKQKRGLLSKIFYLNFKSVNLDVTNPTPLKMNLVLEIQMDQKRWGYSSFNSSSLSQVASSSA
jgi:hypothetical protein